MLRSSWGSACWALSFAFRAQPGCPGRLQWADRTYVAQGTPAPTPAFDAPGEPVAIGATFFGLTTRQMYGPPGSSPSTEAADRPERRAGLRRWHVPDLRLGWHQPQPGTDELAVVDRGRRPILLLVNPTSGGKAAAPGGEVERPQPEAMVDQLRRSELEVALRVLAEGDDAGALAAAAATTAVTWWWPVGTGPWVPQPTR